MRKLIPLLLFLATPSWGAVLASDNFNRGDSTGLGANWAQQPGSGNQFDISSLKAVPHSASSGDSISQYTAFGAFPNDQYAKVKVTVNGTSGGGSGLGTAVRMSGSANTLYGFVADHAASGNVHIFKRISGSFVDLVNVTQAFTDGDYFEFRAQGTTLSVIYNGSTILSTTDPDIASGLPGIYFSTAETSASGDDWEAGDFTVAAAPVSRGISLNAGNLAINGGQVTIR